MKTRTKMLLAAATSTVATVLPAFAMDDECTGCDAFPDRMPPRPVVYVSDHLPGENATASYIINGLRAASDLADHHSGCCGSWEKIVKVDFAYDKPFLIAALYGYQVYNDLQGYHGRANDVFVEDEYRIDLRYKSGLRVTNLSGGPVINFYCDGDSYCIKHIHHWTKRGVEQPSDSNPTSATKDFPVFADGDALRRLGKAISHLRSFQGPLPSDPFE
ncbi:MAG: hypothetical protein EOR63_32100 [Mesorhizobium sp.]|nr:MAG: hypothetical protein EOR63_32100 [Mesorhizobium sp.]